jgi:hypothetical protein
MSENIDIVLQNERFGGSLIPQQSQKARSSGGHIGFILILVAKPVRTDPLVAKPVRTDPEWRIPFER